VTALEVLAVFLFGAGTAFLVVAVVESRAAARSRRAADAARDTVPCPTCRLFAEHTDA
jgi:hypothetical protein